MNEGNLLNEKRVILYDFTFKGMVDYNGRKAYKIAFDQKDDVRETDRKILTILIQADSNVDLAELIIRNKNQF